MCGYVIVLREIISVHSSRFKSLVAVVGAYMDQRRAYYEQGRREADDDHGESQVAEPVLERADQRRAGGYPERAQRHHEG